MPSCTLIVDPIEVHNECATLFGVEPHEIMSIALAAAAARNEKTDLMPAFSGGMLAHIYGVEQLKAVFAYKGGYTTDAISTRFRRAVMSRLCSRTSILLHPHDLNQKQTPRLVRQSAER